MCNSAIICAFFFWDTLYINHQLSFELRIIRYGYAITLFLASLQGETESRNTQNIWWMDGRLRDTALRITRPFRLSGPD